MTSEAPAVANRRIAKKSAGPHSGDYAKQSQFAGSVSRQWRP